MDAVGCQRLRDMIPPGLYDLLSGCWTISAMMIGNCMIGSVASSWFLALGVLDWDYMWSSGYFGVDIQF